MWPEVSQMRQPHNVTVETNNQTGGSKPELDQVHSRVQKAGLAILGILGKTEHYVARNDTKGAPHTMISEPVGLREPLVFNEGRDFCGYIKLCVGFGKTPVKEVERGKLLHRTKTKYVTDFDNVANVGVIYLSDSSDGEELPHKGSAHWYRTDEGTPDVLDAIERGIEAIQNTFDRLSVVPVEKAS